MFRRFSPNFAVLSIFLDVLFILLALKLALLLRPLLSALPGVQLITAAPAFPFSLQVLFPVIWVGVLLLFSVYDGRQNLRVASELSTLTAGSVLALVALAGVLYLSYRDLSRALFLSFFLVAFLILVFWRLLARLAFRWNLWSAVQPRRVLILGAGVVGCRLQEQIRAHAPLGLTLVGFLDDDPVKQRQPFVLGSLDTVHAIAAHAVDDVVLALPLSAHARLNQVVSCLHDLPVRVWIIPDYFSLSLHRASVDEFAGIPMLNLRAPALSEYQRMIKRIFDVLLTLAVMPLVLPLMALAAFAIRLDSSGPVFFRQKRAGENGCVFEMIKFRTMVADAETQRRAVTTFDPASGRPLHKHPADPRVTRVGRFLRRSSLDELPQLFNVLRGEMSLVGPRPEMPDLVEKYDLWQRKRFAVPQGMTGWWQIHGRSDKPMHLHTEEDLYYVQHYSIWLDLQILFQTAWVVLRGKGAY